MHPWTVLLLASFVSPGLAQERAPASGLPSCASPDVLAGRGPASDDVDAYIEAAIARLRIPGLSLAVVCNGGIVKAKGYGFANLELQVKATEATVYEIGSLTKQFTATAILMLASEGRLRLEDPVSRYFPAAPSSWARITLAHLLTHTSGIRNHSAMPDFPDIFRIERDRDELLDLFFALPLDFQPGETWAYDNTGYILLGYIIEAVGGTTYWELLEERIFAPLGMATTRSSDFRPIVPNRASGYVGTGDGFQNQPVLPPYTAFSAGALLSTVVDLARWEAALWSATLLPAATLDRMWTPARLTDGATPPFHYGFGWFVTSAGGRRFVHHGGGTPGFASNIYRVPDHGLAVIILSNHTDRILETLAIDIAAMYLPALRPAMPASDPHPETTRRLQRVLTGYQAGSIDAADFTPPMRLFLSTPMGRDLGHWLRLHGPVQSLSFVGEEQQGDERVLRYRVFLGEDPYWFTFRTTSDGQVAQIAWW